MSEPEVPPVVTTTHRVFMVDHSRERRERGAYAVLGLAMVTATLLLILFAGCRW